MATQTLSVSVINAGMPRGPAQVPPPITTQIPTVSVISAGYAWGSGLGTTADCHVKSISVVLPLVFLCLCHST